MMKQIDAPNIPIIFSNSGNTMAKNTNNALTPIRITNLLDELNAAIALVFATLFTPNNTSKEDMIGFALRGVLAKGIKQINDFIKGYIQPGYPTVCNNVLVTSLLHVAPNIKNPKIPIRQSVIKVTKYV